MATHIITAAAKQLRTGELLKVLKVTTQLPNLLPPHASRDDNTFLDLATSILADRESTDATILFSAIWSLMTIPALRGLLFEMMQMFSPLWNSGDLLAERREKLAEFLYQTSACLAVSVPSVFRSLTSRRRLHGIRKNPPMAHPYKLSHLSTA